MNNNQDQQKNQNNIPDNDPSKAMDSRKEVERSNDEKIDQDFPGYPHYPAKEDIMDQRTDTHRVDLDVENIPSNRNVTGVSQRYKADQLRASENESGQDENMEALDSRPEEIGAPHNVTKEDLDNEKENDSREGR